MKKTAWKKDILRTIKHGKKRFVSILIITALGVIMSSGLRAACVDLRKSADAYMDSQNLYDIMIQSTLGLTDDDVTELMSLSGVSLAGGTYAETVYLSDETHETVSMETITSEGINVPYLVDGTLPEAANEIAVTQGYLDSSGKQIGDTLTIEEIEDDDDEEDSEDDDDDDDEEDATFYYTEFVITAVVQNAADINNPDSTTSFRDTSTTDYTFFVSESAVNSDVYTAIYIIVEGAAALNCYSDDYEALVSDVIDEIEQTLKSDREEARTTEIINEAQSEIDDAQEEMDEAFEEADEEIAEAQAELDDARQQLDDGWEEYYDGLDEIESAEEELDEGEETLKEEQASALEQIEQAKAELEENAAQLEAAFSELEENEATVEESLSQVEEAIAQIEEALAQLEDALSQIEDGRSQLEDALSQIEEAYEQLSAYGLTADEELTAQYEELTAQYEELTAQYEELYAQYEELSAQLTSLYETLETLNAAQEELAAARAQLEAAQEELLAGEEELSAQEALANEEFAQAWATINESRAALEDAIAELEDGLAELEDGEAEYADGLAEFEESVAEYEQEKADAIAEIEKAQAELDDLDDAIWYVSDRSSLSGYANVDSDSGAIEAIGNYFPVIFLAVAVLISLTTITRMVEEERGLIGTYKALGFTDAEIRRKYLVYALSACLAGCLIGEVGGFIGLPAIVFIIFGVMYSLPAYYFTYDLLYGLLGPVIFFVAIGFSTWYACRRALNQRPAVLMRPKAPKAGSKVLLERIPFIWKRFSFLNKVTARNLFRYKKRLFMTIIGIMGCTGLLVFGFSIKDSVSDLVVRQYEDTYKYDLLAVATDNDDLIEYIDGNEDISEYLSIRFDSVTVEYNDTKTTVQIIVVPDDYSDELSSYISLETIDGEIISLESDEVLITRNVGQILDFSSGATVFLQDLTLASGDAEITALVKNYLGNYVYMTQSSYEEIFDKEYEANGILANFSESVSDPTSWADTLARNDSVSSAIATAQLEDEFSMAFILMDMVVYIIIIMAAALAFVVLFTLSTTNISEREREIATIKVLGFHDKEVHLYINKETLILTIIGIIPGLFLGTLLGHGMTSILKMPSLYFAVSIHPISYVISAVLTFVFAILVQQITNRILNKVDPVDALKSVE